jgi:uncharacterized membrane protein
MDLRPITILTATTAVAGAAAGGLFYAFSTFVMRGLDRTGPVAAITAMRGINAEANANAAFLVFFLGSAVLAMAVGVVALFQLNRPGGWLLLAGAVAGVLPLIVTMAFNVPLNNHLDGVDLAGAATEWRAYLSTWTAWNHVRTVSGFLAGALLLAGLRYR